MEKSAQEILDEIAKEEAHDKEWIRFYNEQQKIKFEKFKKKKKLKGG